MSTERVVQRIEASEALSAWADRVAKVVAPLRRAGRLRDVLSGTFLGHPLHPALVSVPLGCWGSSAVLDVLGPAHAEASRRLVGIGVLAAAPTMATGASDWLDTQGAERRVGTAHALANNAALVGMATSWLLRRSGRRGAGIAAGGVGLAAAAVGGWLGGHLAYRRAVGVDTTAFQAGPQEWTPVLAEDELADGALHARRVDGTAILLARLPGGRTVAMENRCTHRGGPLHEGELRDGCVTCPWHASRFDATTGAVVRGPASAPQPVYEHRTHDGTIEIRRDEPGGLRSSPQAAERELAEA